MYYLLKQKLSIGVCEKIYSIGFTIPPIKSHEWLIKIICIFFTCSCSETTAKINVQKKFLE